MTLGAQAEDGFGDILAEIEQFKIKKALGEVHFSIAFYDRWITSYRWYWPPEMQSPKLRDELNVKYIASFKDKC